MPSLQLDTSHLSAEQRGREGSDPARPPIVIILGPTAVGKTQISIQLAERLAAEIVSADSRLFYRGMDIGTAKPSAAELARVPHHLIDIVNPDEPWSLALFQERAQQAIAGIHAHQRLPFLVGGTGQYIRSVTEGWDIPRAEPDPRLRAVLEDWADEISAIGLHARLAVLDPLAAEKIDPRNLRRTERALEVILSTGKRFSEQRRRSSTPYRLLQLGLILPREELYARIDERIDLMFQAGLVEEVQGLLESGYSADLPPFSAIGYRQVIAYLLGELTQDEAVTLIRRDTRVFVRRQANWFKQDDPTIHWYQVEPGTVDAMEDFIRRWLAS